MSNSQAYLRTRVMSASPVELRLMLFDGAIRFLTQGLEGLERRDYEAAYDGHSKCQAIVVELLNTLEPKHAPDLCEKLNGLYTFMYLKLVESLTQRDPAIGRDVLELLEFERETWRQLMEKLAAEGMELNVPDANDAVIGVDAEDMAARASEAAAASASLGGATPVQARRIAPRGYGASTGDSSLSFSA